MIRLITLTLLSALSFEALAQSDSNLKLLVHGAVVIPVDGSGAYLDPGYIAVGQDGEIVEIGAGAPPADLKAETVIDAAGKIITPGFLSGHSHLYQSAFRGLGVHYTLAGWISTYHGSYGPLYDPEDLYWYSRHGAMDYLGHGITTIFDWTLNNWTLDRYVDLYRGSLDSGARIIFGYGLNLDKDLDTNRQMLRDYLKLIKEEQLDTVNPKVPAVWMSGIGLLRGPEAAAMEFTLAREFDLPMQVHYLEEPAPDYVREQQELFPMYEQYEVLGKGFNFAHFINTSVPILEKTAASGTGMIWNPLSNGRLASGLADIPSYQKYGIPVGMGIDGQASADISDPFENMRMGMYAIRMKYQDPEAMMPLDVLRLHTIGTAKVFGIEDQVGSLEAGKFADFNIIDPREMETSPPIHPIEHIVLSCSVANLDSVYVGGELSVKRGHFPDADYAEVKAQVSKRVAAVRERLTKARQAGFRPPGSFSSDEKYIPELEHPGYVRALETE
ncbi:MAG: amidohydrolase family protein [Proteobacteria bacterium]|nr:amidohydrolase family protein [Pseudomonadota bacterium]